jgi:hypothetical protein
MQVEELFKPNEIYHSEGQMYRNPHRELELHASRKFCIIYEVESLLLH